MLRSLVLLLLAGSALAGDPGAPQNIDIVFIGDSITFGAGLPDPGHQSPPVICCAQIQAKLAGTTVYLSNQGHSGHTTVDFLPSAHNDFSQAEAAAHKLVQDHPGKLVFSIMLGTNDSATKGARGAPVSPDDYQKNLTTIIDQFLADFPNSQVFIQQPIWYAPNAHTSFIYGQAGLDLLNRYFPAIKAVVDSEAQAHPGLVHAGDTSGYAYFQTNYLKELRPENGVEGTFYLHPNVVGAVSLGSFWANAILAGPSLTH